MKIEHVNNIYFNLSSTLHFPPNVIDDMKLYMAIVYIRRLRKAGYFEDKKSDYGTPQDFTKVFGNSTGS